jgi:hypothetical protein
MAQQSVLPGWLMEAEARLLVVGITAKLREVVIGGGSVLMM